jgi:hypothetical protein
MSTLDQRIGAQAGQAIAYANDAALAIAREVTRQQRQIVQELRTPIVVETPADRLAKKDRDEAEESAKTTAGKGQAGRDATTGSDGPAAGTVNAAAADSSPRQPSQHVDVRI